MLLSLLKVINKKTITITSLTKKLTLTLSPPDNYIASSYRSINQHQRTTGKKGPSFLLNILCREDSSAADQEAGKLTQIQRGHANWSFLITHHQNKSWNTITWGHAGQLSFQTPIILCCAAWFRPCALQAPPRLGNTQPVASILWPPCSRVKHFQAKVQEYQLPVLLRFLTDAGSI